MGCIVTPVMDLQELISKGIVFEDPQGRGLWLKDEKIEIYPNIEAAQEAQIYDQPYTAYY